MDIKAELKLVSSLHVPFFEHQKVFPIFFCSLFQCCSLGIFIRLSIPSGLFNPIGCSLRALEIFVMAL